MKKKIGLLLLVLALVLLLAGAYVLYQSFGKTAAPDSLVLNSSAVSSETASSQDSPSSGASSQPEKVLAPDFLVYDREGNEVRLSDFQGKPVVLNFWASWCGPCLLEMPDFNEKHQELSGEVEFMMVNMTDGSRETVESASAFIDGQEYTFPVYYDTDSNAAMIYGVSSIPSTYFIDADGYAVAHARGTIDADTLNRAIELIYP